MTPEQLQQWRDKIEAGRQPEGRPMSDYTFNRGWNEALDFVERCRRDVMGENNAPQKP